jgi:hypothetical protein
MKHKIALIVASLAVMMAMIGSANADLGIAVVEPQITVAVGADGTQYVTVTTPGGTGTLEINGIEINGVPTPYNVWEKFTVAVDGSSYTGTPVPGDGSLAQTFAVKYTNDKGIPDGDYKVEYSATYLDSNGFIVTTNGLAEIVSIEASVLAIPEFPTVALPVAAVIGLVFFFQHRKRKEE